MSNRGLPHHNRRGRNHSTRGQHQSHQERQVQQERVQRRGHSHGRSRGWGQASRHDNGPLHQIRQSHQPSHHHEATPITYWTHEDLKHIANSSSQVIVERVQNEQNAFIWAFKY